MNTTQRILEGSTTPSSVDWNELHNDLSKPFPEEDIRFRAGAFNREKTKAIALPYADARTYEDRLNAICPGAWQVDFQPWGESRIICRLTIYGITRSSTGEAGDSSPEISGTSAEAQALKRACSKFGLGRYLYDLPTTWVSYDPTTKRLLESPRLPPPTPSAKENVPEAHSEAPFAKTLTETLGAARAVAMHEQLLQLGLHRDAHFPFASGALGRNVTSFAALTEDKARKVWRHAIDGPKSINLHCESPL